MARALGAIYDFISSKPSECGLPQQSNQQMAAVPASTCVGEHLACHGAEAEGIVEFAIGQQSRIGGKDRATKLQLSLRSKSSRRTPSNDSPIGFSMTAPCNPD